MQSAQEIMNALLRADRAERDVPISPPSSPERDDACDSATGPPPVEEQSAGEPMCCAPVRSISLRRLPRTR